MTSLDHYEKIESYLPLDLFNVQGIALAFLVVYLFIVARYFISVLPFYIFFWKSKRKSSLSYLHDGHFSRNQIKTEIIYSLVSSFIFALGGVVLALLWQADKTQIYLKLNHYGYPYLLISFLLLSIIHEIYFYITHRWMHLKSVFKHVHHIHHLSKNTSPWASFSFHPYEAIILAAFLPLIVIVLPLHPLVLIAYMTFMTLSAISNHLGVELWKNQLITNHFISGGHHAIHHKRFDKNFGLYYCFMDRLFKTENIERNT